MPVCSVCSTLTLPPYLILFNITYVVCSFTTHFHSVPLFVSFRAIPPLPPGRCPLLFPATVLPIQCTNLPLPDEPRYFILRSLFCGVDYVGVLPPYRFAFSCHGFCALFRFDFSVTCNSCVWIPTLFLRYLRFSVLRFLVVHHHGSVSEQLPPFTRSYTATAIVIGFFVTPLHHLRYSAPATIHHHSPLPAAVPFRSFHVLWITGFAATCRTLRLRLHGGCVRCVLLHCIWFVLLNAVPGFVRDFRYAFFHVAHKSAERTVTVSRIIPYVTCSRVWIHTADFWFYVRYTVLPTPTVHGTFTFRLCDGPFVYHHYRWYSPLRSVPALFYRCGYIPLHHGTFLTLPVFYPLCSHRCTLRSILPLPLTEPFLPPTFDLPFLTFVAFYTIPVTTSLLPATHIFVHYLRCAFTGY